MLFYSKIDLNGEKLIALLYKGTKDGETFYKNNSQMLYEENMCQIMTLSGNLVNIDSANNHPLILAKPISSNIDMTAIYSFLLPRLQATVKDTAFEKLAIQWNTQTGMNLEAEDFHQFFMAMRNFQNYMKSPVDNRVEVPGDLIENTETRDLINNLNANQVRLSYIRNRDNITRRMNSPKDRVMIKLPTYEDCVSYVNGIGDLVEIYKEDVMPDYPKSEYKTPMFRDYLDRGYDVKNIIGFFDNNKPGVYDNEKELYDRLVELINLGIEQEFPEKSVEECAEEGISSPNVRAYLTDLACRLSRFGWNHCPNMPVDVVEDVDEDGDSVEEGAAFFQSDGTVLRDQTASFRQAVSSDASLENFIENASRKNIYAVAETIVKLLRWGERKPSELVLDKLSVALDLNTFMAKAIVPSIDECTLVLNGGSEFTLVQTINFTGSFKDLRYLDNIGVNSKSLLSMNLPIGAMLVSKYKQPNSEALIERRIYVSTLDIIEILNKNPKNIKGIEKDAEGNYVIEPSILEKAPINISDVIGRLNKDTNGRDVVYTTDDIKELCIKLNQKCNGLGYLKIIFDYMVSPNTRTDLGTLYCISREDFIEKAQGSMYANQVIRATIGANSMPQVLKTLEKLVIKIDEEGEDVTLEDAINLIDITLMNEPIDLSLEDDEDNSKSLEQIKMDKTADKLSRMMIGASDNKEEKKEEPTKDKGEMKMGDSATAKTIQSNNIASSNSDILFMKVKETDVLMPVIFSASNQTLIGYVTKVKEGDKSYLLLTKDNSVGRETNKRIALESIAKFLFNDYFYILTNQPQKCNLRYTDSVTAAHFTKYIRTSKIVF